MQPPRLILCLRAWQEQGMGLGQRWRRAPHRGHLYDWEYRPDVQHPPCCCVCIKQDTWAFLHAQP